MLRSLQKKKASAETSTGLRSQCSKFTVPYALAWEALRAGAERFPFAAWERSREAHSLLVPDAVHFPWLAVPDAARSAVETHGTVRSVAATDAVDSRNEPFPYAAYSRYARVLTWILTRAMSSKHAN